MLYDPHYAACEDEWLDPDNEEVYGDEDELDDDNPNPYEDRYWRLYGDEQKSLP